MESDELLLVRDRDDALRRRDPTRDAALERIKQLVLDSVASQHSKDSYDRSLTDFLTWYQAQAGSDGLNRASVQRWVETLRQRGLAASTINVRLAAVRKLALEAADNKLLSEDTAQSIKRVKGAKKLGVRTGNWLTASEAAALIKAPDVNTLKGRRDCAILSLLIAGALRRSELSRLQLDRIQQREGRWVLVDIMGKGNRTRTVPITPWAKAAVDGWTAAAQISSGSVFRSMNNKGQVSSRPLLPQNVMELVTRYGRQIGQPKLAPHDLRRTCAKLAERGGAQLRQIQIMLGHASLTTTEKYLGSQQDIEDAPCDYLGIKLSAASERERLFL